MAPTAASKALHASGSDATRDAAAPPAARFARFDASAVDRQAGSFAGPSGAEASRRVLELPVLVSLILLLAEAGCF